MLISIDYCIFIENVDVLSLLAGFKIIIQLYAFREKKDEWSMFNCYECSMGRVIGKFHATLSTIN